MFAISPFMIMWCITISSDAYANCQIVNASVEAMQIIRDNMFWRTNNLSFELGLISPETKSNLKVFRSKRYPNLIIIRTENDRGEWHSSCFEWRNNQLFKRKLWSGEVQLIGEGKIVNRKCTEPQFISFSQKNEIVECAWEAAQSMLQGLVSENNQKVDVWLCDFNSFESIQLIVTSTNLQCWSLTCYEYCDSQWKLAYFDQHWWNESCVDCKESLRRTTYSLYSMELTMDE